MPEERTCLGCGRTYLAPSGKYVDDIPDIDYCSEECVDRVDE